MRDGLPDPEMRRYLLSGSIERVTSALSKHIANGLEISNIDNDFYTLSLNDKEYIGQTKDMLKFAVRGANSLFEGEE